MDDSDLSRREAEVLRLLAKGLTKKEVATRLKLRFATVCTYTVRIYQKLHVSTRGAAVAWYFCSCAAAARPNGAQ